MNIGYDRVAEDRWTETYRWQTPTRNASGMVWRDPETDRWRAYVLTVDGGLCLEDRTVYGATRYEAVNRAVTYATESLGEAIDSLRDVVDSLRGLTEDSAEQARAVQGDALTEAVERVRRAAGRQIAESGEV